MIVLAFVVLLTGLVLAFLADSLSNRKVAGSSASQTKVELFAEGAADTIISDLKQEIAAGSTTNTITTGNVTTTIYTPLAPTNAVPALVGSTGTNGLENLVKRSASGQAFYPAVGIYTAGPSRASSASTTNISQNGRSIPPARWNKPLLMPCTGTNDLTPASADFTPPDWILVARDGSNPTTWTANMVTSPTSDASVVGRYAYAIYDEGGLLDMNVAGYPSGAAVGGNNTVDLARKGSPAFSDLTQLPLASGNLLQADSDTIIAWRNASVVPTAAGASDPATGAKYLSSMRASSTGFLTVGGLGDQAFVSRQSLISFLTSGKLSLSVADARKILQYLGTFSRALEQPSYAPPTTRPKVVPPSAPDDPVLPPSTVNLAPLANYRGGNDAYNNDDVINPSFLATRVSGNFTRSDGTIAKVGDPLVLKRFALARLAWLTYAGPITLDGNSYNPNVDPSIINALVNKFGFTNAFLLQGTAANITKYFGLTWNDGSHPFSSIEPGNFWTYDHGVKDSTTGTTVIIAPLSRITGREPDFFELLKAAVNVGSLGKSSATERSSGSGEFDAGPYYQIRDKTVDYHVIQIGANIIDQFDIDWYPTRIALYSPIGRPKMCRGIENLPYIYRTRIIPVQLAGTLNSPFPAPTVSSRKITDDVTPIVTSGGSSTKYSDPSTFRCGNCVMLGQPEIWNPHAINPNDSPSSSTAPTSFRIYARSQDPDAIQNIGQNSFFYFLAGASNMPAQFNSWDANNIVYSSLKITNGNVTTTPAFPWNTALNPRQGTHYYLPTSMPFYTALTANTNAPITTIPTVQQVGSELLFTDASFSLFKNPTVLGELGNSTSSTSDLYKCNLQAGPGNIISQNSGGDIFGYNASSNATLTPNKHLLGFYMGEFPAQFIYLYYTDYYIKATNYVGIWRSNFTTCLQYEYPARSGNWITYNESYMRNPNDTIKEPFVNPAVPPPYTISTPSACFTSYDPRTGRFAHPFAQAGYGLFPSGITDTSGITDRTGSALGPVVANRSVPGVLVSTYGGATTANYIAGLIGWNNGNATINFETSSLRTGDFTQNIASGSQQYYRDADDITRRAMGAYATTGAATTGFSMSGVTGNSTSSPIILNRPFRSVAELGYVFKDTPWKNIDFFTPETGDAALLDVFCINEPQGTMVAGRVNLNTRQAPVLKAVLSGSLKDERDTTGTDAIQADVDTVAAAMLARTTSPIVSKGPFANISELAGRLVGTNASGIGPEAYQATDRNNITWIYSGLSAELTGTNNAYSDSASKIIQRRSEAAVRAFSAAGQTRVWNLLIDVVAQVGSYPSSASNAADPLSAFVVRGEKRCWYHVAIDRLTGVILDSSLETVSE